MIKRLLTVLGIIAGIITYIYLSYLGGRLSNALWPCSHGHDHSSAYAGLLGIFGYPIMVSALAGLCLGVYSIVAWIIEGQYETGLLGMPTSRKKKSKKTLKTLELCKQEYDSDLEEAKRELDIEFPELKRITGG